ncbi:hypothetical protein DENSPDRAFT_564946 [Dentipellis sp. KUC8613]|nr:hypothetical protein DENSPDRAFT_564946 [Dentipellis sp. KUC8613]
MLLRIYLQSTISDSLRERLVEILAHLLGIIGIVTKDMKHGRLRLFVQNVCGKDEALENALEELDELTKYEIQDVVADTHLGVGKTVKAVDALADAQRKAELRDCFQWLSASDEQNSHDAVQKKATKDTGNWIFNDSTFNEWMRSENQSFLWLHGKSGGGKSVLCSTIINLLQEHRSKVSCALAFFYFDYKSSAKWDFCDLLKSLLGQLSSQSPQAVAVLKQLYADHNSGIKQPTRQKLLDAIRDILEQSDAVYIVLDALDECGYDAREEHLFPFIKDMLLKKQYSVHLLVTSRIENDIQAFMHKYDPYVVNLGFKKWDCL